MSKLYRLLLVSLVIALLVTACGGGDDDKDSSDTGSTTQATATAEPEQPPEPTQPPPPTQAPEATAPPEPTTPPEAPAEPTAESPPEPTTPPEAPAEPPAGKLGELLKLDSIETNPKEFSSEALESYRLHLEWYIEPKEGSTATAEAFEIEVAHTSDPLAEEMHMSIDSQDFAYSMIHIGDRLWVQTGEQWIEMSSDEISEFDQMLYSLDSATSGLSGDAELVGQEDLNGVATNHYRFDETVLGAVEGFYNSIAGDVWVAVDGEYVVKYAFTAEDDEATYRWDWEVYDINAPLTIEPPTGAQGARQDIPILPDATDKVNVGGMVTYQSASDMDTAVSFYQEQMPANGWTYQEAGSMVSAQFAMLNFGKDGETASVTVAPGDGGVSIVIQLGE